MMAAEPVRVGIVGVGRWGPHLLRVFTKSPDVAVTHVVDRDRGRLDEIGAQYPSIERSTSVDSVIGESAVDALVVATPASTHHDIAGQALDAGLHVFVEKPLALSLRDASDLLARTEAADRVLMVGHVFLHNPAFEEARRLLQSGAIGDVLYLSMRRTNLGPRMIDTTAVWDLAVHDIAIANTWLAAEPIAVTATGHSFYRDGKEDLVFAAFEYPDDKLMHVHASWIDPKKTRFLTAVGDEGMLTVDDMDDSEPLRIYDSRIEAEEVGSEPGTFASFKFAIRSGAVTIPAVPAVEPLTLERDEFIRRIRTGSNKLDGAREGVAVVRALEAVDESIRQGRRVPIDSGDRGTDAER